MITSVFVVGSGFMGSGIAQVCAQSRINVLLYDINADVLKKALNQISWSLTKLYEKGKISEEPEIIKERIRSVESLDFAKGVDLVIEAVFEDIEIKKEIFLKLDSIAPPPTILASNTSSIPITELASVTRSPERVLGLHFFSPVPLNQAVEVVKGMNTSEEVFQKGKDFVSQLGKEPILVQRDVEGFVLNRINLPSVIEAIRLVEEGIATVEDIDKGLKLAYGRMMGIFETSDMVGLDVTYGALMSMYRQTGDPRWFPPLLMRRMVKAGLLGKKTGRGWYQYNPDGTRKEA